MNGVILASHGNFASGLYSTVKMIAGEFENVIIVEFKENDTLESVDQRINEAYKKLKSYENILVLTDLAGGTPFNRAVMALGDKENVRILAGMNFAMVYQALSSDEVNLESFKEEVLLTARDSIVSFETTNKDESEEEDFSDGI